MNVLGKELTEKFRARLTELAPAAEKAMESIAESLERKGIEKGRREGIEEGARAVVQRQLMKKFGALPANLQQKLEAATESELAAYADRLLDAQTLDEVFED